MNFECKTASEEPMAAFDGEAFIDRFNTVWDAHDIDGIAAMFTDDVIFESSFGTKPYGERAVGGMQRKSWPRPSSSGCPTCISPRSGTSSRPVSPWSNP
jgi:hypothetical protein